MCDSQAPGRVTDLPRLACCPPKVSPLLGNRRQCCHGPTAAAALPCEAGCRCRCLPAQLGACLQCGCLLPVACLLESCRHVPHHDVIEVTRQPAGAPASPAHTHTHTHARQGQLQTGRGDCWLQLSRSVPGRALVPALPAGSEQQQASRPTTGACEVLLTATPARPDAATGVGGRHAPPPVPGVLPDWRHPPPLLP